MSKNVPSPEGSEDLNPIAESCQVLVFDQFRITLSKIKFISQQTYVSTTLHLFFIP
jgi:hypothetical protein